MTLLDLLVRIDDRINTEVDKHVHRHPTFWIIVTSLLIVAVILALRGAIQ